MSLASLTAVLAQDKPSPGARPTELSKSTANLTIDGTIVDMYAELSSESAGSASRSNGAPFGVRPEKPIDGHPSVRLLLMV